jgi:endonuclease YncB( thermonuclease family)
MAESAKSYVEQMIRVAKSIKLTFEGWDKYGGRVLGYIEVDGQNLADRLIAQGLAAPYTGQGPKKDWCA